MREQLQRLREVPGVYGSFLFEDQGGVPILLANDTGIFLTDDSCAVGAQQLLELSEVLEEGFEPVDWIALETPDVTLVLRRRGTLCVVVLFQPTGNREGLRLATNMLLKQLGAGAIPSSESPAANSRIAALKATPLPPPASGVQAAPTIISTVRGTLPTLPEGPPSRVSSGTGQAATAPTTTQKPKKKSDIWG
jgi:hypothetical protein